MKVGRVRNTYWKSQHLLIHFLERSKVKTNKWNELIVKKIYRATNMQKCLFAQNKIKPKLRQKVRKT